jgi:LuxR family quorum sensing-dependent transcriptional regulator
MGAPTSDVLSFLELQAGLGLAEMLDSFRRTIAAFGFSASAGGAFAIAGKAQSSRFFFNDWPGEWLALYVERGLGERDPIVLEARHRIEPFQWRESTALPSFTGLGAEAWSAGLAYGWRDGFSVPIHGPGGYHGLISLAARKELTLSSLDRALLVAVSHVVHDRCRRSADPLLPALPELTPRELECFAWVAAGKTDWEIAQLLGVTQPTVHFHIEKAKRRIGLRSRAQAVAMLVLHGLI